MPAALLFRAAASLSSLSTAVIFDVLLFTIFIYRFYIYIFNFYALLIKYSSVLYKGLILLIKDPNRNSVFSQSEASISIYNSPPITIKAAVVKVKS